MRLAAVSVAPEMKRIAPARERQDARGAAGGRPRVGLQTIALFLAFLGFYLLTASGHFYAVDEETLYRITESIVERHTVALPNDAWGMVGNRAADGGPLYAQYTPGQSVVAIPLYLLGRKLAIQFPPTVANYVIRFCVSILGAFVTAATVALLYRLARHLGYRGGHALALAAIYGLATTAWPHGRTFFAEPLTALCLLAAFVALRFGTTSDNLAWLGGAGLATTAACIVKPHAAIAVPILGLYLLARTATPRREDGDGSNAARERWNLGRVLRAGLAWGAGLASGAIPFAVYNARIYGSPFRTGYVAVGDLFSTPFLTGLYGLTISSGKGIVWYSPPILLAIAGWWRFRQRHAAEAFACLGIGLVHLAFYSRINFWHGDGSWGPRYLTIALPFLILPLLGLFDLARARAARRATIAAIVAAGVAVQLLGVLVNFDWYLQHSDEQARHFSPAASPILAHARILGSRFEEWTARRFPPDDAVFLRDGFSYPEGQAGALLPRWTNGAATVAIDRAGGEAVLVKLTFFDHRPLALRTDQSAVIIDGKQLPDAAIERNNFTGDGQGWTYQFTVPPGASPAYVTLQSTIWNPRLAGQGNRDEDLGVFVHNIEVWREGQPLQLREGLAFPILPSLPRHLFWWFNDDATRHHPLDWWATYAIAAGLPRKITVAWLIAYGAAGLGSLAAGIALGWWTLPGGMVGMVPTRRRRRRTGRRRVARG